MDTNNSVCIHKPRYLLYLKKVCHLSPASVEDMVCGKVGKVDRRAFGAVAVLLHIYVHGPIIAAIVILYELQNDV